MTGFQIVLLPLLPLLPPAPIVGSLLPSLPSSACAGCEIKLRSKYRERLTCATGLEQALQGCLTHGDVGVPGPMWLTSTLVLWKGILYNIRRRLPSLIRLNRRHFELYRHSYNQEKEA